MKVFLKVKWMENVETRFVTGTDENEKKEVDFILEVSNCVLSD